MLLKKLMTPFFGKKSSLKDEKFEVIESQSTPNPDAYRFQLNKLATESDSINFDIQILSSRITFRLSLIRQHISTNRSLESLLNIFYC